MNTKNKKRISKLLSLLLRHQPEKFNLTLDAQGWCSVEELLNALRQNDISINHALLEEIVKTNDKKRFAYSEDQLKIRASQGHSISIDLEYEAIAPPEILYHGTAERNLKSIRRQGLQKRARHHVHLSADPKIALEVGRRYGMPRLLVIQAGAMHRKGHLFYCSENKVWLTEEVPPEFFTLE